MKIVLVNKVSGGWQHQRKYGPGTIKREYSYLFLRH